MDLTATDYRTASCGIPESDEIYPTWAAAAQAALDAAGLVIMSADKDETEE